MYRSALANASKTSQCSPKQIFRNKNVLQDRQAQTLLAAQWPAPVRGSLRAATPDSCLVFVPLPMRNDWNLATTRAEAHTHSTVPCGAPKAWCSFAVSQFPMWDKAAVPPRFEGQRIYQEHHAGPRRDSVAFLAALGAGFRGKRVAVWYSLGLYLALGDQRSVALPEPNDATGAKPHRKRMSYFCKSCTRCTPSCSQALSITGLSPGIRKLPTR